MAEHVTEQMAEHVTEQMAEHITEQMTEQEGLEVGPGRRRFMIEHV
jgi:hypothetical protein